MNNKKNTFSSGHSPTFPRRMFVNKKSCLTAVTLQNYIRIHMRNVTQTLMNIKDTHTTLTTAAAVLKTGLEGRNGNIGRLFSALHHPHMSDLTIYSTWPEHVDQTSALEATKECVCLQRWATRMKVQHGAKISPENVWHETCSWGFLRGKCSSPGKDKQWPLKCTCTKRKQLLRSQVSSAVTQYGQTRYSFVDAGLLNISDTLIYKKKSYNRVDFSPDLVKMLRSEDLLSSLDSRCSCIKAVNAHISM